MARQASAVQTSTRTTDAPLTDLELQATNAYWRACNYLSVGMIYLQDNPLLREPLKVDHVKHRLLGHWGASPALSFVWVHLNRLILKDDLDVIFVAGPGHGAPGVLGPTYLEGTYSEIYPDKSQDVEGMRRFFRQFSFPGHIGSHVTPETPGSIHEGGELGYSLSHAYGMAFDNPDLIVACVVGDGEAETGPLATAWHSNKFVNPVRDGAVLPILNLNGYKIANPTILSRISHDELTSLMVGYGYMPLFVEGDDPAKMHQLMASTLEQAVGQIRAQQKQARDSGKTFRPQWPMIVLRSPKGWTGPKEIKGHKVEGSWRSHQVPFSDVRGNPASLTLLADWLQSYKPEELFDRNGTLVPQLKALAPRGNRRISANPHANGGLLRKDLRLPDFRKYAVNVPARGAVEHENTKPLGQFLRDTMKNNMTSFRVFGPDETASNRLQSLYEVTKKTWMADMLPEDADGGELSPDGRVMEMLSEHTLLGWLEGYLLTGRHGFFHTYEAFAHVVDSMFNQHAKWLDISKNHVPWRASVASENILLSSTVWRQDHNGFSHQDPGFIDLAANKGASVVRVYLPPDANTLLVVADHCLRSTDCINVIVADKQKHLQFTTIDEAITHCAKGIGIWPRASTDAGRGGHSARAPPRSETTLRQRRRPVQAAARVRTSPWLDRARIRQPVHQGHADHLQLPRLSLARSPAGVPIQGAREPARARLQGEGQHQHTARTGNAQRDVALPSRHRRHRSGEVAHDDCRTPEGTDEERDYRQHALRARARHRPARSGQLDVAVLMWRRSIEVDHACRHRLRSCRIRTERGRQVIPHR
jgi:xylulose-5-phosphate/fructose-6-phosphate phosphoketolase